MKKVLVACFTLVWFTSFPSAELNSKTEIEAFNQKFLELHRNTDTDGILGLWADDGVDLMPGQAPLVGKAAITAWLKDVLAKMPGYKVAKQDIDFHDIRLAGDWASEWATEHQVVQPPDGKPVIESYGKMALVLHREPSGQWKIVQEMWNAGVK
jgi:uncharacterized protein (TIGR02246 family)